MTQAQRRKVVHPSAGRARKGKITFGPSTLKSGTITLGPSIRKSGMVTFGGSQKHEVPKRASKLTNVTESSGNVFADFGIPNPEEHLLKAELVLRIAITMKECALNQTAAAEQLGVTQPDVSRMLEGHFRQFSVERLMRFLVALGQDVEIVVHPRATAREEDAKITVTPGLDGRATHLRVDLAAASQVILHASGYLCSHSIALA
jgi:predicted XRE-type DNA-binding protein